MSYQKAVINTEKKTMRFTKINEEVLYAEETIIKVGLKDIEFLKEMAKRNRRKRVRLCAHKNVKDKLHEMLIVHMKDTFVRPHKHLDKSESWHVIEGVVDVIIFNDDGNVNDVIKMGDYVSDQAFYYRISTALYHTLLIRTDVLVFHETTTGPFNRTDTVFAPWSPEENDTVGCALFMKKLSLSVGNHLNTEANKL